MVCQRWWDKSQLRKIFKGFLNALVKIGYDGPVRAEPFNQSLRDLEDDPACKATVDSLKKAFKLIG